jgi:hypothetical protein
VTVSVVQMYSARMAGTLAAAKPAKGAGATGPRKRGGAPSGGGAKSVGKAAAKPGASRMWLGGRFSTQDLVDAAVGTVLALSVYLAAWHGLFYYNAPFVQLLVLSAATAGLIAKRWQLAAGAAGVALLAGWLLFPPVSPEGSLYRGDLASMAVYALGGAVIGGLVAWLASKVGERGVRVGSALLVCLVLANFCTTTVGLSRSVETSKLGEQPVTISTWLQYRPVPGQNWSDEQVYLEEYHRMTEGSSYYDAVRTAWTDNATWGVPPGSVFEVRPPAVFWLLRTLAPRFDGVLYVFLAMVVLAAAAAAAMSGVIVRPAFAVLGATLVVQYYLFLATTSGLIDAETWGSCFALAAVCCVAASQALRSRWRAAFIAGAAAAAIAAMMREFFLIVPAAGVASTFAASAERKKTQWRVWAGAWAAVAVYYAVHVYNASHIITGGGRLGLFHWWRPGLGNMGYALIYATNYVGPTQLAAWVAVALGLLGIVCAPPGQARRAIAISVVVPLAFFAVFRNDAALNGVGTPINYWGVVVTPIVLACVPLVFSLVPGFRDPALYPARLWSPGRSSSTDRGVS